MGWWSTEIMGGDTPMDLISELNTLVGGASAYTEGNGEYSDSYLYESNPDKFQELLEKVPEKIFLDFIGKSDDRGVRAQVVAHLHMLVHATLPTSLKMMAITACKYEDVLLWNHPEERKAVLMDFVEKINHYGGKPGLASAFSEPGF